MTTEPMQGPATVRLARIYDAPPTLIWELWTTAAGLEEWLGPDGFRTQVNEIELRPGGHLGYTMTAVAPEQVAFVQSLGLPTSSHFRRTYTVVAPPTRLAYVSVIDFIPDRNPYEHLTVIHLEAVGDRTEVVMLIDPLHDEAWTQEYSAHRGNELDNLGAAIRRRMT